MTRRRVALLAPLLTQLPVVASQSCTFSFPDEGLYFDLSSLATASPFTWPAGASMYTFSFCGNLTNMQCPPDGSGSVSAQLAPDNSCLVSYGQLADPVASVYSSSQGNGLVLTYSGGAACSGYGTQPSTTHTLLCASGPTRIAAQSIPQPGCALTYTIYTPAACASKRTRTLSPLGAGWVAFSVILAVLLLYCVGGSAYKRYKFGASGLEAVPHIDTWRAIAARVAAACSCCTDGVLGRGVGKHAAMGDDDGTGGDYYVEHSAGAHA